MIKVITPPATEPVTLTQAKLHCRVDHDAEDSLIDSLITAARVYCEGVQNRAYVEQTLELTYDKFPAPVFYLPRPPLRSVESIKYTDKDGTEHIVDSDNYITDTASFKGRVSLKYGESWPSVILQPIAAVKIRFTAGYDEVPQTAKQAMLLLIGHWYVNREGAISGQVNREIEFAVNALLGIDRVWSL